MSAAVSVHELQKAYGDTLAVRGISFAVQRREIFGLLGPNGAGKTTALQVLTTLLWPTAGRVEVDGLDVTLAADAVRQRIGLVFQEPSLDLRLTARENLLFHARLYRVPRADRPARAREMLDLVELAERADDLVETFSGGMRRRLEVARALLHRPPVLFLDEPTIGLDPQTRERIWEYILRLRRDDGTTVVMTTHYMDEAERCDRVAIIDHGVIQACDTPAALKRRLGGDVVVIDAVDPASIAAKLPELGGGAPRLVDSQVVVEHENGPEFAARVARTYPDQVRGISAHRPTLADVFLAVAGRALRDEAPGETQPAGRRRAGRRQHGH